jgi:hypothetical protein
MEVSINGGSPIIDGLIMENPMNMDDFGVPPFQETSIQIYIYIIIYISGISRIGSPFWLEECHLSNVGC